MDKLKLGIQANDEIQPDLRELIDAMNKLSILPSNFDGKAKIQKWLVIHLIHNYFIRFYKILLTHCITF
jgi:hypothetical protein